MVVVCLSVTVSALPGWVGHCCLKPVTFRINIYEKSSKSLGFFSGYLNESIGPVLLAHGGNFGPMLFLPTPVIHMGISGS